MIRTLSTTLNSTATLLHTVIAYDGGVLRTWTRATQLLFKELNGIMSNRCFYILEDDGNIVLMETNLPENADYYLMKGNIFRFEDIRKQSELLATGSSRERIIPSVIDGSYEGVGEGFSDPIYRPSNRRLLLRTISMGFRALLFVQQTEQDDICFDIADCLMCSDLEIVNKV